MKRLVPAPAYSRPLRAASNLPETEESGRFWFWVGVVALGHLALLILLILLHPLFQEHRLPPVQFISLMPSGTQTQGTPGAPASPKVAPTTTAQQPKPAPAVIHPPPVPEPVIPPPPAPVTPVIPPPPLPQPQTTALTPPLPAPAPKPATIVKPKVDLTEVARPAPAHDKPKHHHPKPVTPVATSTQTLAAHPSTSEPASPGLSPEQIASELGQKLQNAGVAQAIQIGPSGSENSEPNRFAAFYAALRDQTMSLWQEPQVVDKNAANPVVQIHVNPDGTVPADKVVLLTSSGDSAYDNSALSAARSLGKLTQPLPDGCPPDISINFTLTH